MSKLEWIFALAGLGFFVRMGWVIATAKSQSANFQIWLALGAVCLLGFVIVRWWESRNR